MTQHSRERKKASETNMGMQVNFIHMIHKCHECYEALKHRERCSCVEQLDLPVSVFSYAEFYHDETRVIEKVLLYPLSK